MERLCTPNMATLSMRMHLVTKPAQTPWITFRGHSRSFWDHSKKPMRNCVPYYCIIMWALQLEISKERSEHLQTTLSFSIPCLENPCIYSHKSYTFRNYIYLPSFSLLILYAYLCSFFCGGLWNLNAPSKTAGTKTEFDMKIPFRVILGISFLQRVSIACYAKRCTSYRKSVRLSVRPSVCLSVTRWHCVKTTPATIMGSSLEDSPMTLVSSWLTLPRNSEGNIGSEGTKWERGGKNSRFSANKSPYLRNGAR